MPVTGMKYYVNRSTTLIQIDSSQDINPIVHLSSVNTPGALITIRDIAGSVLYKGLNDASNNIVTISTMKDIRFLHMDSGNRIVSSMLLSYAYGFITVTPKTSNVWAVVNTQAFPSATIAASLINLTSSNAFIHEGIMSTCGISSLTANNISTASLTAVSTLIQSNLFVPFIYNSSLQTSSVLASTVTAGNIYTSSIQAISTLIQSNLFVPFIYNSSLQTSSVLASTVTTGNIYTSSIQAISTLIQSNLFVPFIYNSSLQTSSVLASTVTTGNIYTSSIQAISTLIQSNLFVPFIYNSSLQTSSVLASTVTAGNIYTSSIQAISTLIQSNLYVPFIYNSSLQTSSIMASTIIASSITTSTIATSTLSAYSMIVQSNIQTLGSFIGDGSLLTGLNIPATGNDAQYNNFTVLSNLYVPFIYNSSLRTSSIMASTIIASSITASTIATSTLSAYSIIAGTFIGDGSGLSNVPITGERASFSNLTVISNLYVPFIYNSSLQTSSILASTVTTGNIYTSSIQAISTIIQSNLFVPFIYNSSLQTSSILASTVTTGNIYTSSIQAISTLIQSNLFVPFIYNSSLQTSSILASTVTTGNIYTSSIQAISTLIQSNLFVPFIYNSSLQTSSVLASTVTTGNIYTSSIQAISTIIQSNLFVPFIYNSSLRTSSIMASTIIASSITTSTIATSTLSAYSIIVQGDIQTLGVFRGNGSGLTNLPNSGDNATFSNLTATFIYNSSLRTSSIMASTIIASSITTSTIATSTLSAYTVLVNGNTNLGGVPGLNNVVTTLAGSGSRTGVGVNLDGIGAVASFNEPFGIAVAPDGNIYIGDIYNNRIRKVTPDGIVTTIAGSGSSTFADGTGSGASFQWPSGVAIGPDGNIYVADSLNARIRKVTPDGVVTTLAGSGLYTFGDGIGTTASFKGPKGIAIDPDGNIYVADTFNNRIRKVTTAGVVTTLAGSGSTAFADGTGDAAMFVNPEGIAVGPDGTIYVADTGNHRIRVVTAGGVVRTLAGGDSAAFVDAPLGPGLDARFWGPRGIAIGSDGNIYVADRSNNRIRKVTPGGLVTTLAGQATFGSSDGTGAGASFNRPSGLAIGSDGNIYVADTDNLRIRKIDSGLANVNMTGNVYVANYLTVGGSVNVNRDLDVSGNTNVRGGVNAYGNMIVQGDIQTLGVFRGNGSGLTNLPNSGDNATFSNLTVPFIYNSSLRTSSIMASTIIASSITTSTIATSTLSAYSMIVQGDIQTTSGIFRGDGSGLTNLPNSGGSALFNTLTAPFIFNSSLRTSSIMASTIIASSITTSTIATSTLSAYTVLVNGNTTLGGVPGLNNVVTTFAGTAEGSNDGIGLAASFKNPGGVAVASDGTIYVADTDNHCIRKVTPERVVTTLAGSGLQGSADGTGSGASFRGPRGIAIGPDGNIYVADINNNRIRKVTPDGVVTTLAGSGTYSFADGTGTGASFKGPRDITIDPDGNIYVADTDNNRIRKVTPHGVVTTLAGSGAYGYANGLGANATFGQPYGIDIGIDGNLYVADTFNHIIRKVTPQGVVTRLAGSASAQFGGGTGTGTNASFKEPGGIAVMASDGNIVLYVADTANYRICKITFPNGTIADGGLVSRLAGSGAYDFSDGTGTNASFKDPGGIAIGPDGTIYVADTFNKRIRKIDSGLSRLNMSGNAYFTNFITAGGSVNVDGDLDVSGNTNVRGGVNSYKTSIFSPDILITSPGSATTSYNKLLRLTVDSTATYIQSASDTSGNSTAPLYFTGMLGSPIRMTIADNGNVGIGKTNPAYALDVVGTIYASGDVLAQSDMRVKTNIVEIDSPLEKISQLRGVFYNRRDDSNTNPARHLGVIAQEVETVLPEVVSTDNSEAKNKSVAYGNIVALLIEAVKAQQSTIEGMQIILSSRT